MEKRIKVKKEELAKVQETLKDRGYSIRKINNEIGSEFKNFLYKGHSMTIDTFKALEDLLNEKIDHREVQHSNGKSNPDNYSINKNEDLAELIGIILGDGHIRKRSEDRGDRHISQYYLQFTFHEKERELISRTNELCNSILGVEPSEYPQKGRKTTHLKIHSKELVEELEELGLEPGNKSKNQVKIPEWIFKSKNLQKRCISGLVDTDGCIYTQKNDDRTIIKFSNRSKNLKKGFKRIAKNLGMTPSKAGKWEVQLAHQKDVHQFLSTIEPIKRKNANGAKGYRTS